MAAIFIGLLIDLHQGLTLFYAIWPENMEQQEVTIIKPLFKQQKKAEELLSILSKDYQIYSAQY